MGFEIDNGYFYYSDGVKLMPISDAVITTAEVDDRAEMIERSLCCNKEMEFNATIETTPEAFN